MDYIRKLVDFSNALLDFHIYSRVFSEDEIGEYFKTGKLPNWAILVDKDKSIKNQKKIISPNRTYAALR